MTGHGVAGATLIAQVEGLIARVGRQRLLEILMGARAWDVRREPTGLTLSVDGVPLVHPGVANGPLPPPRPPAWPGYPQPKSEGSISHQFSSPASS